MKGIDTQIVNQKSAKVRLNMRLAGHGFVNLESFIKSYEPFKIEGSLELKLDNIATITKYLKDEMNLEVAKGDLHLKANYIFDADDFNASKISELSLNLYQLSMKNLIHL